MKTTDGILREIRPDVDFDASANFIQDGLLDSLDIIRLVDELNRIHGISIAGNEIASRNFVDVASINALVERTRSAASTGSAER